MIHLNYVYGELFRRWRRTSVGISIIAFSIGVLIVVNALGGAFQQAFRAPLEDVGATLTVQRAGNVPEKMEGPVFPCSVVPIYEREIRSVRELPGVQSVSEAVLFWDFAPKSFRIVVGLKPDDTAGPALVKKAVVSGRFLDKADTKAAVVDTAYARNQSLKVGDKLDIRGEDLDIVGVVDSSRISHVGAAQVYIPLTEARRIAVDAPGVKAVHTFGDNDSNLLFVRADRDKTEDLAKQFKEIMGEQAAVSSPASFKEMLGSAFALTDRFSWMISVLALLAAFGLTARTTAANVRERRPEIGTMKAVGWTSKDIVGQIGAETLVIIALGAIGGTLLAFIAAKALSFVAITIPIPWEMSPRPHFLPGGADQLTRSVNLSVVIPPLLAASALLASLVIGIGSALVAARSIIKLKPSEVLRYE